jgi:hypothetical protein
MIIAAAESLGIRINEIMYNPAGDDYAFEFIELYSKNETNVSSYYFEGIDFEFPENSTIQNYTVIANTCNDSESSFAGRYQTECLFEYQGTLSNAGETITIFSPDGGIATQVNYSDTATENFSLELTQNGWLVSEIEGGTPGSENSHPFLFDDTNQTNSTINETINETNNETINSSINATVNETNQTNTTSNTTKICNPSLGISLEKTNFDNGESIKFKHIIENNSLDYNIEYWIEDMFGKIVKSKRNTTNTNEKSYTPNIKEKEKILAIKSILYVGCNDTNLSNNLAEKIVFVLNEGYEEDSQEKTASSTSKTSNKPQKPYISSFYTLTKNFQANKTIKLYAYVSNPGPGSEFSLFFNDSQSTITQNLALQENQVKKLTFEAMLQKGSNDLGLSLFKDNHLIDFKQLEIFVNSTDIEEKAADTDKEKFINSTRLQITEKNEADEGVSKKKNSIGYYIFLGLSVIFNAILIWKR